MGLFFYRVFLLLYSAGAHILALRSNKARLWLSGRKNIFDKLKEWRTGIGAGEKLVWIHCASLGEFEQGRPVIEKIRMEYPAYKILITFYSPSGYEIRKNYGGADGVFYLPVDGKKNALKFIETITPSLVIWVKYEYWYYYLTALKKKNIPVILISSVFRKNQPFFKWYGRIWRKILTSFTQIFVQHENSIALLRKINMAVNATAVGDTRFDRVIDNAEKLSHMPDKLLSFCKGHRVIVGGSTWEEDEEEIVHYVKMHRSIKFIIVPHEIDKERLIEAKKLFGDAIFYSEFIRGDETPQVIILDNIGMLSKLYSLADVAYVGGGFNESGIHNILEAAVYGKPVIFGPEYEKFQEANDLIEKGGAFSIETALELEAALDRLLKNADLLHTTGAINKKYVYEKAGATVKIFKYLQANLLLTS